MKKVNFEKKRQTTKKHEKLPSMQRVNVLHISCFGISNNDAGKTISAEVIRNETRKIKTTIFPHNYLEQSISDAAL